MRGKHVVWAVVGLVAFGALIASCGGSGSKTHSARKTSKGKAKFVLVVRQSACGEDPTLAYLNCHVAVRNVGTTAGDDPEVYVGVRYDDNGENTLDSALDGMNDSDQPGGFKIYPHTTRVIYLQKGYNATKHNLIQAFATLDLNANRWPYIPVTT
jgi:hypothetical protein